MMNPEIFAMEDGLGRFEAALHGIREGLKGVLASGLRQNLETNASRDYLESYRASFGALSALHSMFPDADSLTAVEFRIVMVGLAANLDPEISLLMDSASGEPCQGASDWGVVEELEGLSFRDRLVLRAHCAPNAPLIRDGWLTTQFSYSGRLQLLVAPKTQGLLSWMPESTSSTAAPGCSVDSQHAIPVARLGDLVLSGDVLEAVSDLVAAAKGREVALEDWGFKEMFRRGLAISALFDGEPGTGKTLTAEVLAGELGKPLQRVNVARILDKYVGGTQKNIEAAFEEASRTGSVLLFDEADALFSRRMNIESSQDRHANLEINLLLEWMERFDGTVVLTTNLKQGMDPAFERRIGYKIHFSFPDATQRSALWERMIPARTPVRESLDFQELGIQYELSGGSIKNALLRAAYRCAARGEPLHQLALESAAEQECIAAGKLVQIQKSDRFESFVP